MAKIDKEAEYYKAKKRAEKSYKAAVAEGRYPYLPALETMIEDVGSLPVVDVGKTWIPTSMIVGTKTAGRQNSFSEDFLPLLGENSEFAMKWKNVYEYQVNEGISDPILVFEYMKKFYVQEGNKRVSVFKYLDVPSILAEVKRILPKTKVGMYEEFLKFYEVAHLYDFEFSAEKDYYRFASLIGESLDEPWTTEKTEDVRSAFSYFTSAYYARGGRNLGLSPSDAFLVYLSVYPLENLIKEASSTIETQVGKIWNELLERAEGNGPKRSHEPVLEKNGSGGLFGFLRRNRYSQENPIKVAFFYDKNPGNSNWIYGHELGRNHINERYGGVVKAIKYENLATDDMLKRSVDDAVREGVKLFITTSPTQMEETVRCAYHYPDLWFLNCSVSLPRSAVRSFYAKMYEAKFLMGALAASYAENGRIGYLADYPIYGSTANINAFAIGVSMVDPRAKVYLKWSSIDTDWRREMREQQIHVYSGVDFVRPDDPSREYGVYVIDSKDELINLGTPIWNWGRYYEYLLDGMLSGVDAVGNIEKRNKALSYWWGMSSGVVDIILSQNLPYTSRKMVRLLKEGMLEGRINPFCGELRSQQGLIKPEESEPLTSPEIITMDWLNDNIVGEIPPFEAFEGAARHTVEMGGYVGKK